MKRIPTIPCLLVLISLVSYSQETLQNLEGGINKTTNAEPSHATYQLDSGRVTVLPLHGMENGSALFSFQFQPAWSEKQIFISVEEISQAFHFIINGFTYGFSGEDSRAVEFNITPFLKKEENLIELAFVPSEGNQMENWNDPLRLIIREPVHVRDFHIQTYSQQSSSLSIVRIHLFVTSYLTARNEGRSVAMTIFDQAGELVGKQQQTLDFPIAFRQEVELTFDQTIADPVRWSPANPVLYDLQLQMVENSQADGERVSFSFGIRSVSVEDSLVVINQDTLKLKVANSETLHRQGGQSEKSITKKLKENGFNGVQFQPYYPSDLMDQFDRAGILVLKKEENHDPSTDRRDMNRPSLIIIK